MPKEKGPKFVLNKNQIKDELQTLRNSCMEGHDGTWDSSTEEGREGFLAMVDGVNRIAKLLNIKTQRVIMSKCNCPTHYRTRLGKTSSEELITLFVEECFSKAEEINPDNELCWASLVLGWALAKCMSPKEANTFALHVLNHTNLIVE